MLCAPNHPLESARIASLQQYEVLDSEEEAVFDDLTALASEICNTPISLISLVDIDRQWFKSRVGLDATETPREFAFCSHAILDDGILEVPNAIDDERFHDNPLVTGAPDIRFYAGAPILASNGMPLGTLCVIDSKPGKLNALQRKTLITLARQVTSQLELRIRNRRLARINEQREKIFAAIAHDLRGPFNGVLGLSKRLRDKAETLDSERIAKIANAIFSSGSSVFHTLDELLQWTQYQLGNTQCDVQPTNLKRLVEDSLIIVEGYATEKQIAIVSDIPQAISISVDPTLSKTIIRNLCVNAVKYAPHESSIQISCSISTQNVKLSITDEGPGVSASKIGHLFSHSVNSEPGSENEAGSGIGLSLCNTFATMQSANLSLDTTYKDGAKFDYTVPLSL